VRREQIKFQSESVMADVCLGVTVAGLYTLVGRGLLSCLCEGRPSVGGLFHVSPDYGQPRCGLPAGQIWN
jgi:hypothetical protein